MNFSQIESYKTIGFDLDDTLYPIDQYDSQALKAVAASLSCSLSCEESLILEMITTAWDIDSKNAISQVVLSICDEYRTDIVNKAIDSYNSINPSLELKTEVTVFLDSLAKSAKQMFIVTDGETNRQIKKFNALKLYRFISPNNFFICDPRRGIDYKPSIAISSANARLRWFAEHGGVYIGDRNSDEQFAANLGFDYSKPPWEFVT